MALIINLILALVLVSFSLVPSIKVAVIFFSILAFTLIPLFLSKGVGAAGVQALASNYGEFGIDNFGPFSPSCPLESEKANHISLLLDILDNTLLLNIIVFILVLLTIIGLTLKLLSEADNKLEWIKKIYFGNKIHFMVLKLTTMWKKTNISIIYFALFCILIFVGLNSYFLYSLSIMFLKVFNSLL